MKQNPEQAGNNQQHLTTNQGVKVSDNDNSLEAGIRGGTLMDDFHFREKMTHFDHERIPERVVHARGSGAYGVFQVYDDSLKACTKARFLTDPTLETTVFVRFSTVAGSRGSADTVRDARGFATKFYTTEGNYDLVANNIPVFFIQDAIKFPDVVHAVKPEPHNEIPQASAAHDTFWDFISLMPESMHMILWLMGDRALPRSYSMMEGFGVHTFRLVNEAGESHFVKFHWKPIAGVHGLTWDETQKLAGKDPDYNRRDLWDAIEKGNFPEFELGLQIIKDSEEFDFDFDILDATKIWPEALVPVRRVGKMTLNRNPDNFFAETEQIAFHPGHVVPGIDFTNDPLLQGRLFSYIDTQLIRLGGPNFAQIPVNRPHANVVNNQRDGYMQQHQHKGRVHYSPNSLGGGCPFAAGADMGAFTHYAEKIDGQKIKQRSESLGDHYSQARLFYNSQSEDEQRHIYEAFLFELGKVETPHIRERMLGHIARVDTYLARRVAEGLGMSVPTELPPAQEPPQGKRSVTDDPALSMERSKTGSAKGRKVAVLAEDGFDGTSLQTIQEQLTQAGAECEVISKMLGERSADSGETVRTMKTYLTASSVMYDAVVVAGGAECVAQLRKTGKAIHFLQEAFVHCKPIAFAAESAALLQEARLPEMNPEELARLGVLAAEADAQTLAAQLVKALGQHRFWARELLKEQIPV